MSDLKKSENFGREKKELGAIRSHRLRLGLYSFMETKNEGKKESGLIKIAAVANWTTCTHAQEERRRRNNIISLHKLHKVLEGKQDNTQRLLFLFQLTQSVSRAGKQQYIPPIAPLKSQLLPEFNSLSVSLST